MARARPVVRRPADGRPPDERLRPRQPPSPPRDRAALRAAAPRRRRLRRRQGREPRGADRRRPAGPRRLRDRRPGYAGVLRADGAARAPARTLLEGTSTSRTPPRLEEASAAARALFDEHADPGRDRRDDRRRLPHASRAEIAERPVAVRSSATAEDTAEASFAGMNETFLNVRGERRGRRRRTATAGARCSARGRSTTAPATACSQADMDIAVVVQLQIALDPRGRHVHRQPGDRRASSEIVIEGSFGLGEAVVSGAVSPDRYLVEKADPRDPAPRSARQGARDRVRRAGGGTDSSASSPSTSAAAGALRRGDHAPSPSSGRRIEQHYGEPQDTEWAFDPDGRLWMLQSRPITTLRTPSAGGSRAAPARRTPRRGAAARPRRRPRQRQRAGADPALARRTPDSLQRRRRARHAHDSARLDGADAPRRGDRHRLRRHDLPRRDRLARAWASPASSAPARPRACSATARSSRSTPPAAWSSRAPRPLAARGCRRSRRGAGTGSGRDPATQLLVNLSEPSQVARVKDLPVDGVGLLRAELMVLEALDGEHPRLLLEEGRGEEFVDRMADALTQFATASRRGRSPTGRSTSAPTSSAGCAAASASSPTRRTR